MQELVNYIFSSLTLVTQEQPSFIGISPFLQLQFFHEGSVRTPQTVPGFQFRLPHFSGAVGSDLFTLYFFVLSPRAASFDAKKRSKISAETNHSNNVCPKVAESSHHRKCRWLFSETDIFPINCMSNSKLQVLCRSSSLRN